jgi:hypothetical protein
VTEPLVEPVVRIRCIPEQEARTLAVLERAGFAVERSLTWLVVRDADPDQVNEALASGGALPRVAVRDRIGALLGWLVDHGGAVAGREAALERLVQRVLADGGLERRYAARPAGELAPVAAALYERLLANGAAFLAWPEFVAACLVPRDG